MSEASAAPVPVNTQPPRRRRLQFGLRSMLIFMALFAAGFAWWWSRPVSLRISKNVTSDYADRVQRVLDHPANKPAGGSGMWAILDDKEFAQLKRQLLQPAANLPKRNNFDFNYSDRTSAVCYRDDLGYRLKISGFFGAATWPRGSAVDNRDDELLASEIPINFEGPLPKGHLIYLRPCGSDIYCVVTFEIEP
jgi:hypothetical protein